MGRLPSDKRKQAYKMFEKSGGKMLCKDIAAALGVSASQVRNWKAKDKWDSVAQSKNKVAQSKKKHGAPYGNKNALGNNGGAPKGNKNAQKHGFFSRIFPPDDEEAMAILNEIEAKSPLDILWENIVIQYTAIARAQKIMYVQDKEDLTKHLKRERRGRNPEKEYELQFAWEKHANFLQAQSRAMLELRGLIKQYEELLRQGYGGEAEDWVKAINDIVARRKSQVSDHE